MDLGTQGAPLTEKSTSLVVWRGAGAVFWEELALRDDMDRSGRLGEVDPIGWTKKRLSLDGVAGWGEAV